MRKLKNVPKKFADIPADCIIYDIMRFHTLWVNKWKTKYEYFGYFRVDSGRKIYYLFPSLKMKYTKNPPIISFANLFYLEAFGIQNKLVKRIVLFSDMFVKLEHLDIVEESKEWSSVKPFMGFFSVRKNCFPKLKSLRMVLEGNRCSYANVGQDFYKNSKLFGQLEDLNLEISTFHSLKFFTTPGMFRNLKKLRMRSISSGRRCEVGIPSLEELIMIDTSGIGIKPGEKLRTLILQKVSEDLALLAYSNARNIKTLIFRSGSNSFLEHLSKNPHPKLSFLLIKEIYTDRERSKKLWLDGLKPLCEGLRSLEIRECKNVPVELLSLNFKFLFRLEFFNVSFNSQNSQRFSDCGILKHVYSLSFSHSYFPNELFTMNECSFSDLSIQFNEKEKPDHVVGRNRTHFFSTESYLNGINWKVSNLLSINLENLPNFGDHFFSKNFENLYKIQLFKCKKIRGTGWNKTFPMLDELEIDDCENVTDLILKNIDFPNLRRLYIGNGTNIVGREYDWIEDMGNNKILKKLRIIRSLQERLRDRVGVYGSVKYSLMNTKNFSYGDFLAERRKAYIWSKSEFLEEKGFKIKTQGVSKFGIRNQQTFTYVIRNRKK